MNLLDLIHSKLELFRLEQRYTRRRNRRSTFVSEATYVDGEYIYSPTSTYSARCCATSSDEEDRTNSISRNNRPSAEKEVVNYRASEKEEVKISSPSKRMSMLAVGEWRRGREERKQEKRLSRVSVREIRWDDRS